MTRVLMFTIPAPVFAPVRSRKTGKLKEVQPLLNSNDRRHRQVEAKIAKAWRAAARDECLRVAAGLRLETPVHILAQIHKPRGGIWDPNNYHPTTKPIVDGLVDAGLIPDDSWREVEGPDHRAGKPGSAAVTFTITCLGRAET